MLLQNSIVQVCHHLSLLSHTHNIIQSPFFLLQLSVCQLLDLRSLIAVSSVNKELSVLCKDPYLWRHMLLRDFGESKDILYCVLRLVSHYHFFRICSSERWKFLEAGTLIL